MVVASQLLLVVVAGVVLDRLLVVVPVTGVVLDRMLVVVPVTGVVLDRMLVVVPDAGGGAGDWGGGGPAGGGCGPAAAAGGGDAWADDVEDLPRRHSKCHIDQAAQQPQQPVTIDTTATNTSSQSWSSQLFTNTGVISSSIVVSIKKALLESNHHFYTMTNNPRNLRKFTDYGPNSN